VIAALRTHAVPLLVLAAAVAALYGRTIGYDFVRYDDHELIVQHYGELVRADHLASVFWRDPFAVLGQEARGVYYRPLLVASYAIDARIAGPQPMLFHAVNVALHGLATAMVYALLVSFGSARALATALALVFAAHPAAALVPTWIPCRNESMLAIAAIGTLLAWRWFLDTGRGAALALSVVCYAVSLFTKESGIVLLGVLACAALLFRSGRPGEWRALARAGAALFAVTIAWAALRHIALGRSPVGASRAFDNLPMLVAYLGKMVFPVALAPVPHPADTPLWPGIAALAVIAVAAAAMRDRLVGAAGFGLIWCAAFLAPSLSVPATTWGLEHRVYLPLAGLLLFASQLAPPVRVPNWLAPALAGSLALVFAVFTARRLPDFADAMHYWQSAARAAPHSAFAASRVAWRLYEAERFAEVPDAAEHALAIDPQRADMYLVRGLVYARRGDFVRAEPDLRRATELDPDEPNAWANLARLQRQQGRYEESRVSKQRADRLVAPAP
jgi:protein O-mannosyl-transferase